MTNHQWVPETNTFIAECPMCGRESSIELDPEKYRRWRGGELCQNVWPEKSLECREVLISGTCIPCQKELFQP